MNADINAITEKIIGCAYRLHNKLGYGFLEKVYENGLAYELRKLGFHVEQQRAIPVMYEGVVLGEYVADLVVDGRVLIELKAIKALDEVHSAQCINYLAATGLSVCLLINFGRKVDVKRFVRTREDQ